MGPWRVGELVGEYPIGGEEGEAVGDGVTIPQVRLTKSGEILETTSISKSESLIRWLFCFTRHFIFLFFHSFPTPITNVSTPVMQR